MTLHKSGERPEQDLSLGHKISIIAVNNQSIQRVRLNYWNFLILTESHAVVIIRWRDNTKQQLGMCYLLIIKKIIENNFKYICYSIDNSLT